MKNNFLYFLLFISFFSNIFTQSYEDMWLSFPACHMGRLQSPVRLNISESKYSNSFSIVYQYFDGVKINNAGNENLGNEPSRKIEIGGSGYINLQRNGVIKQYSFKHIEMFRGLHKVESSRSEFEVHLIFEKVLGFSTNQNQYRRITDTNNYLAIVLRYNNSNSKTATQTSSNIPLASDGGLLDLLLTDNSDINFNDYPIFDRRAFFYEGSQIYNPCSEDYNYIVLYDTFKSTEDVEQIVAKSDWAVREFAHSYDRPIYRNFMNYTETISSGFLKINLIKIIGFLSIILL
jgi:carbonic anhydrase